MSNVNIGVFGLGYVGIVNVACFAKQGYKVWCTDVKPAKTDMVAQGQSPIYEPEVDALLQAGIQHSQIIATQNVGAVIENADVLMICVGTPSKPDGEVNLTYLNNVIFEIASQLPTEKKVFLVFRSTVPPGTTEEIVNKYLQNHKNVIPVFYPEFLREGSAVHDFFNYGRFVLGYNGDQNIRDLVQVLHNNTSSREFITDLRTAEFSKYADNSFHALKVAFANEIFGVASSHGVDVKTAYEIFVSDEKLNVSKTYLKPGMPFGGSCLPKDLRELSYLMQKANRNFPLIESIIPSNHEWIEEVKRRIAGYNKRKISFLGITFKNDSDDLRESPVLRIVQQLEKEGNYDLRIWDEDMNEKTVRVEFPDLFVKMAAYDEAVNHAELLVVSKKYMGIVRNAAPKGTAILNLSDLDIVLPNEIGLYS